MRTRTSKRALAHRRDGVRASAPWKSALVIRVGCRTHSCARVGALEVSRPALRVAWSRAGTRRSAGACNPSRIPRTVACRTHSSRASPRSLSESLAAHTPRQACRGPRHTCLALQVACRARTARPTGPPSRAPALVAEGEERAGGRRAADGGVVLVRVNDAADDADLGRGGGGGGGEEGVSGKSERGQKGPSKGSKEGLKH